MADQMQRARRAYEVRRVPSYRLGNNSREEFSRPMLGIWAVGDADGTEPMALYEENGEVFIINDLSMDGDRSAYVVERWRTL